LPTEDVSSIALVHLEGGTAEETFCLEIGFPFLGKKLFFDYHGRMILNSILCGEACCMGG
jgi:hypothetical protein